MAAGISSPFAPCAIARPDTSSRHPYTDAIANSDTDRPQRSNALHRGTSTAKSKSDTDAPGSERGPRRMLPRSVGPKGIVRADRESRFHPPLRVHAGQQLLQV